MICETGCLGCGSCASPYISLPCNKCDHAWINVLPTKEEEFKDWVCNRCKEKEEENS